jgi:curved DNA-binding protein CbpA
MASKLLYRNFSGRLNYYEILGVLPTAKPAEIKLAYKKLVKQLHPDIAGPNASQERFRQVAEAYSILSKLDTRATYDLTRGSKQEIEAILHKKRDKDGLDLPKPKFAPHQYGYQRMKELAEERKRFNIDNFYRYKGGLPGKHQGAARGNAYGPPGFKADASEINFLMKGHNHIAAETDYVDDVEAHEFKLYKAIDPVNSKTHKPFLRAEIDYELSKFSTFKRHLAFYVGIAALIGFTIAYDQAGRLAIQMKIKQVIQNAEHSKTSYEKAGLRAVSLS